MTIEPGDRYFNTGEVAIHYAEWTGAEPCFLFIHGITGALDTWPDLVPRIAGSNRAVAVDLRGHGRSGHVTGSYRVEDYTGDMAALIEGKRLSPAIVIGHSLGAMTALRLAASRPELVKAIVLEDPPLFAREIMERDDPSRLESFKRTAYLAASGMSIVEIAGHLREAMPEAPEEFALERARRLFLMDGDAVAHVVDQRIDWSPTIEDTMRSVRCPVLLQQGAFDLGAWMRDADGERAAKLVPDCELSKWSDTGHGLHSDRPDRFVEEVNRFLRGRGLV
jgi:pimeloyl-ACP methyl ester carboxylesterase